MVHANARGAWQRQNKTISERGREDNETVMDDFVLSTPDHKNSSEVSSARTPTSIVTISNFKNSRQR